MLFLLIGAVFHSPQPLAFMGGSISSWLCGFDQPAGRTFVVGLPAEASGRQIIQRLFETKKSLHILLPFETPGSNNCQVNNT